MPHGMRADTPRAAVGLVFAPHKHVHTGLCCIDRLYLYKSFRDFPCPSTSPVLFAPAPCVAKLRVNAMSLL